MRYWWCSLVMWAKMGRLDFVLEDAFWKTRFGVGWEFDLEVKT